MTKKYFFASILLFFGLLILPATTHAFSIKNLFQSVFGGGKEEQQIKQLPLEANISKSITTTRSTTTATKTPSVTVEAITSSALSLDSTQIKQLQLDLTTMGYYNGGIDGVYGNSTTTAVKNFQAANGLTATGTVDQATLDSLSRICSARLCVLIDSIQCIDTKDNDGDGLIDYPNDPGCDSYLDNDEQNKLSVTQQCSDALDNDGDGLIDSKDSGCHTDLNVNNPASYNPLGLNEANKPFQCSDGLDNDADGAIDSLDPQCHTDGNAGNSASYDFIDNDESAPTPPSYKCSNGIDDDGDALIDTSDPGCHSDGNANNPASYAATDNDEYNQPPTPVERILLLAGRDAGGLRNDVLSSSDMATWNVISPHSLVTTAKWSPRYRPEVVYFNSKYWVIGGNDAGGSSVGPLIDLRDIWSSVDGTTWVNAGPAPYAQIPSSVCPITNGIPCYPDIRLAVLGSKLFLIEGGFQAGGIPAKVWSSLNGTTWTLVNGNAPFAARDSFMTVSIGNKLYVMGGQKYGPGGNPYVGPFYADVWSSTDGVNWTQLTATAPWGPLVQAKAFAFNNKIYIFGGINPTPNGSFSSLKGWSSSDGITWTLTTANLPLENTWSGTSFTYIDGVVAGNKLWLGTSALSGGQSRLWSSTDGVSWTQGNGVPFAWSPRFSYRMVNDQTQTTCPVGGSAALKITLSPSTPVAQVAFPGSAGIKIGEYVLCANTSLSLSTASIDLQQLSPSSPLAGKNLKFAVGDVPVGNTIVSPHIVPFEGATSNLFGSSVAPLSISLTAGQPKKVSVYMDASSTAQIGTQFSSKFSAASVTPSASVLLSGSLMGNPVTIVQNAPLNPTPRIAYWWGKVNQHVDAAGNWHSDPDGSSGADINELTYCKKWYPNTVSVSDFSFETITGWLRNANIGDTSSYTATVMTKRCVQ